jgi:hypothetical protein
MRDEVPLLVVEKAEPKWSRWNRRWLVNGSLVSFFLAIVVVMVPNPLGLLAGPRGASIRFVL